MPSLSWENLNDFFDVESGFAINFTYTKLAPPQTDYPLIGILVNEYSEPIVFESPFSSHKNFILIKESDLPFGYAIDDRVLISGYSIKFVREFQRDDLGLVLIKLTGQGAK